METGSKSNRQPKSMQNYPTGKELLQSNLAGAMLFTDMLSYMDNYQQSLLKFINFTIYPRLDALNVFVFFSPRKHF